MPLTLPDRANAVSPLPLCTSADARLLGIRLTPARWMRVRKGIYVDREAFEKLPARERYAVRVHAFVRKFPDAVLCLESAGVIHGIPQFDEPRDIHVFDPDRTASWGDGQQNQRGRARMQSVWSEANPLSESPAESISRAVMGWSGFETPKLQREFTYEGALDRADFYFASCRAIGEADGWGKYDLSKPEAAEEHLKQEKRREDRLRRHRHPFARWEMRDAWKVEPVGKALSAAGVPIDAPRQSAMLLTLKHNPRAKPWKTST